MSRHTSQTQNQTPQSLRGNLHRQNPSEKNLQFSLHHSKTQIEVTPQSLLRHRSSTRECLQSSSTSNSGADRSNFMCVPKNEIPSHIKSVPAHSHITSYTEEDSTMEQWGFQCPRKKHNFHLTTTPLKVKMEKNPHILEETDIKNSFGKLKKNSPVSLPDTVTDAKEKERLMGTNISTPFLAKTKIIKPIDPKPTSLNSLPGQRVVACSIKESYRINWQSIFYIAIMVVSGFIGGFVYSIIHNQCHLNTKDAAPNPISTALSLEDNRLSILDFKIERLSSSMSTLVKEISSLQERISMSPEIETEGTATPRKGILEELFSSVPDLACAGNFGLILATPNTTSYAESASLSVFDWLFFTTRQFHRSPQTTIQGLIQEIGDCWAFDGQQGRLVVGLIRPSLLVSVSISHIPPTLSPEGDIYSAPRLFQVLAHYSKQDFEDGIILGEFEYNKNGPWRQSFVLNQMSKEVEMFEVVEFRFLNNHGHPNLTCVYRVHIHGNMFFV